MNLYYDLFSSRGFAPFLVDSLAIDGWNALWLLTCWIPVFNFMPLDMWFIVFNGTWDKYSYNNWITVLIYLTPLYYVIEPIARYILHIPLEAKWDLM